MQPLEAHNQVIFNVTIEQKRDYWNWFHFFVHL